MQNQYDPRRTKRVKPDFMERRHPIWRGKKLLVERQYDGNNNHQRVLGWAVKTREIRGGLNNDITMGFVITYQVLPIKYRKRCKRFLEGEQERKFSNSNYGNRTLSFEELPQRIWPTTKRQKLPKTAA